MFARLRTWLADWRREPTLGERGEREAERFLKQLGYKIVARRDRSLLGELDLVAVDGRTVVFVEVKTRLSHEAGHPLEAVNADKQARLSRLAAAFLKRHDLLENPARFDVLALTWQPGSRRPQIEHYRHAFEAAGPRQMFR